MANLNNIDGTISSTNNQIVASGLTLPQGFSNLRQPNELELLIQTGNNTNTLYNKYSYNSIVPNNQKPIMQSSIGTRRTNYQMALNDVVRVAKFSVSNKGVQFLTHQLLLQGLNSFNETKLYNPLMPVAAATSNVAFGFLDKPTRFIEPNLGGVLGAIGLSGKGGTPQPPVGTVANNATGFGIGAIVSSFLPSSKESDKLPFHSGGGKGLIRGKTATDASANFNKKWGVGTSGGILGALLNTVKNQFLSNNALGTFFPVGQPDGTTYKVGDNSYGVFLNDIRTNPSQGSGGGLFKNIVSSALSMIGLGNAKPFGQLLKDEYHAPTKGQNYDANGNYYSLKVHKDRNNYSPIDNKSVTQYTVEENSLLKNKLSSSFQDSNNSTKYPSAFNDPTDPNVQDTINSLNSLLKVITTMDKSDPRYTVVTSSYVAQSYKDLISIKNEADIGKSPERYQSGKSYEARISNNNTTNRQTLYRKGLDTNKTDNINLLEILDKNKFENGSGYYPYDDDIIAFYFHDLVNDKYIPFRATVKGLQESLSAEWSDIKYINRADKLYSYGGFGRTLGFNFSVVITSIKELLPTWKRINYLAGLTKPANYTKGTVYSRFIIPPLIQFTIGDMYKNQPAVITQIGISIPEGASWQTLSEDSSANKDWSYLNNRIQWKDSKNKYAQFPNECEISIQMNLIEKELPHTGGSNYGDYYLDINQNSNLGSSADNSFSNNLYNRNVEVAEGTFE